MGSKIYNFMGLHGVVGDPETCIDFLKEYSGEREIDIERVNTYARNNMGKIKYLGGNLEEVGQSEKYKAKFKWVDTGYKTEEGNVVYASFVRQPLGWSGAIVGTDDKLKKILNKSSKESYLRLDINNVMESPKERSDEYEAFNGNGFLITLYNRLLNKEYWAVRGCGNANTNRLAIYLESVLSRVKACMERREVNGYILNDDGDKVCINIGLMDKFNNYICVCFKLEDGLFFRPNIVYSKSDLIEMGIYNRGDLVLLPEPVRFYEKAEELVFNGNLDDLDIHNWGRLVHVIDERRRRFPKGVRCDSNDVLCSRLMAALEKAVAISKVDYAYIVPMYNTRLDIIQFIVPLHIEKSIKDVPDLALILGKGSGGLFEIMTILSPDVAYDMARVISKPPESWVGVGRPDKSEDTVEEEDSIERVASL